MVVMVVVLMVIARIVMLAMVMMVWVMVVVTMTKMVMVLVMPCLFSGSSFPTTAISIVKIVARCNGATSRDRATFSASGHPDSNNTEPVLSQHSSSDREDNTSYLLRTYGRTYVHTSIRGVRTETTSSGPGGAAHHDGHALLELLWVDNNQHQ